MQYPKCLPIITSQVLKHFKKKFYDNSLLTKVELAKLLYKLIYIFNSGCKFSLSL